MVFETEYKNRPAVAIKTEAFTAVFLPLDGAKLASFKTADGIELLAQAKGEKYRRLFIDSEYISCECSAFDDMFPTIDPCVIGSFSYPDHGEVCRIEHEFAVNGDGIIFECNVDSVNATCRKRVFTADGSLYINYSFTNNNSFPLPYIWAGHMMFAGERGSYVTENFAENSQKTIIFGNPPNEDKIHILGKFSQEGESYKYYYKEENTALKCGIVYPTSKKQIEIEFDNDYVKYLGVWINNGSFKGMHNIALEPCTAPFDSPVNAQKAGCCSVIDAKDCVEFTMRIKICDK